jgi:hypothetical protein
MLRLLESSSLDIGLNRKQLAKASTRPTAAVFGPRAQITIHVLNHHRYGAHMHTMGAHGFNKIPQDRTFVESILINAQRLVSQDKGSNAIAPLISPSLKMARSEFL